MSTIGISFNTARPRELSQVSQPTLEVNETGTESESHKRMWQQIGDILKNSIAGSGFRLSHSESTSSAFENKDVNQRTLVAPGIAVPKSEYEKRFGCIDLAVYKKQMSPQLFEVFVRYIGSIQVKSRLDIVELTSDVED